MMDWSRQRLAVAAKVENNTEKISLKRNKTDTIKK